MNGERLPVGRSPAFVADMLAAAEYLADRNPDAATRFLDELERTIDRLSRFPRVGAACRFAAAEAQGLRVVRAGRVGLYLLYYRPTEAQVELIRLVHGARDQDHALREGHDG